MFEIANALLVVDDLLALAPLKLLDLFFYLTLILYLMSTPLDVIVSVEAI